MAWHRSRASNSRNPTRSRRIEAFRKSLVNLIDRERPENFLLLNKPTNRIPHAGGERIKPGSSDEVGLKAWIRRLTQLSGVELAGALKYREEVVAGAGHAQPRRDLRRLMHSQYNNTVRDLHCPLDRNRDGLRPRSERAATGRAGGLQTVERGD